MDYTEALQALWVYLVLLFGIIALPGMDMFLIIANALTGERRMGMATLAGVMLGGAVYTLFSFLVVGVFNPSAQRALWRHDPGWRGLHGLDWLVAAGQCD